MTPNGFLGVDLGIVNIATTSDGTRYAGKHLNRIRHRNRGYAPSSSPSGTKSAKRLLKQRCRKEARFAADTNHVIAKRIVTEAERTGRGIALEDLQGIRDRVRLRKPQRVTLHTWSFHQLGSFIAYKALRAGVVVVHVDPALHLAECSALWACRPSQPARTKLPSAARSCGFAGHADWNAARNIAAARWWRAGLPPTSRTRTSDLSPELQADEQLAHPLCSDCHELEERLGAGPQPLHTVDVSRRPDLARRYHVAVVPAAFRVAGDGTVLERLA